MTLGEWKKIALDIKESYNPLPHIILWGGEPLVCPYFDELVNFLKKQGFTLGMITNGVLLDRHMEICKSSFKKIYVSIDGPRDIHDHIRGKGVFDRVRQNIAELTKSDAELVVSAVLSPLLLNRLDEFIGICENMGIDELLLQNYIRLSPEEADDYKKWMKKNFDVEANEINSWITDMPHDYEMKKERAIEVINDRYNKITVTYIPHTNEACVCMSAHKHMHISWNGNVLYCTDFYDFNAGSVKKQHINEIFNNENSEKFRNAVAANPACRHCSWRTKKNIGYREQSC